MLSWQVACSIYFHPRGGRAGIISPKGVAIDHKEFPADWFEGLDPDQYRGRKYRTELNKYKVNAGQNQAAWEANPIHASTSCGFHTVLTSFSEQNRSDLRQTSLAYL